MTRAIVLGDGRRIRLGAYIAAWRATIAAPADSRFTGSPCDPRGWQGSYSRDEVLREFRAGMADRINRHIPGFGIGRKWDSDWQWAALQTAIAVNTPRLVVRWAPADLRDRLAHRLTTD